MAERVRTIAEIEQDLAADRVASAQAQEVLKARQTELMKVQTAAIGWNLDYPSLHAATILTFAERHGLDPHWLGGKVSQAMYEVIRDRHSDIRADEATTPEDYYKLGMHYLTRDHHTDGSFLNAGRNAFAQAQQVAVRAEEARPDDVDPQARNSLFYKFLAENFVGALKQIVHDDFWDNY